MKTKTTTEYSLTLKEVKEVIAKHLGVSMDSIAEIDQVVRVEEIPMGIYDCDRVDHFDGIKVKVQS